MGDNQLNLREMIQLCIILCGRENAQVQVIGHEVRQEYEYIDYYILQEAHPRPRHRIRKFMGHWKSLY